jgi:hypothetical protein
MEAKDEVQMQTLVNDSGILPRYREACKISPSPRWSPSQGSPCKDEAPSWVTLWITLGLPHAQVSLRCAFQQASPRPLPAVFTIKLPAETPWTLFPSIHGGDHTTNAVGVVSQDLQAHQVQQWCVQAPSGKRYANFTKH